jgi:hypothetical protein
LCSAPLATLLNEIIARGGTTALEEPFAPDALARTLLIGPEVIFCCVAVQRATSQLMGFQSLERRHELPDDIGEALSRELNLAARNLEVPVLNLRRGSGSPRLESFFSEDAVCVAGCEMALDVESVLDGGVNGQEALG